MKKYNGEKEEVSLREQILNRLYLFIDKKEDLESATGTLYVLFMQRRKFWFVTGMIVGALMIYILLRWSS